MAYPRSRYRPGTSYSSTSIRRKTLLKYVTKRWDPVFFQQRKFKDRPYVKTREEIEAHGDLLDIFLRDYEGSVPSYETEVIMKFCQSTLPLKNGKRQTEARAWLDIREDPPTHDQSHPKWLTSTDLIKRLKSLDPADTYRHLIYVPRLDRDLILALAETASCHQMGALRDAVWKHIAHETSIRVYLPLDGFTIFHLEFHLPYLALRDATGNSSNSDPSASTACQRWSDLSFLKMETYQGTDRTYNLHQCSISVVLCGWDHSKWVAYAFFDTDFGTTSDEDEDNDDDELVEDMLACDGQGMTVIDANAPIWDPRTYWLRIFEIRIGIISKEWIYLVKKIEQSVNNWKAEHSIKPIGSSSIGQSNNFNELLDWIVQTKELLRMLRKHLSTTVQTWRRFEGPDGDISYFSDMVDAKTNRTLKSIRESFDTLADLKERLVSLDEFCHQYAEGLELHMELVSAHYNLQSRELNRKSHILSLKTNHTVCITHKAAQLTSITAALTLTTSQIMTPVAIVIAYFGTEKAIFGFERNSKTFIICIVIMIFSVRIFNLVAFVARRFSWLRNLVGLTVPCELQNMVQTGHLHDEKDLESRPPLYGSWHWNGGE